jgi:hypothetical protein
MQKLAHDSCRVKHGRDPIDYNLVLGILLLSLFPTDLKMLPFELHLKFFNCLLGVDVARNP